MPKSLTRRELRALIGQDVCITYKEAHNDNIVVVAQVLEANEIGIAIQMDAGPQVIRFSNIKDVSWKNIKFVSPKEHFDKENDNTLNMQMDKINTQIIERIKSLPTYDLSIRSTKFQMNGRFSKKKLKQSEFEAEVFHWVKKRKTPIELCPLALLNNELLLTLYQKRFLLLKKNFSIVFDTKHRNINGIVAFMFDQNAQIKEKRHMSLRGLAEDLL